MNLKNKFGRYGTFAAYLAAVILINAAGMTLFFRIDLTRNDMYSLSTASKKVVSTLSEPLSIKVFFTRNLPAPHNATERYLRDLLAAYAGYAGRYFNYRFYNVSAEEGESGGEGGGNQQLAQSYGVFPVQIQAIEKDEVKFQKAYMGLVMIHGDLVERLPTINGTDGLEYRLTTAIRKLNNKVSALLNLKGDIVVDLFYSSSLKQVAPLMQLDTLDQLPADVAAVVDRLNDRMYGKLVFHHKDPTREPALMQAVERYDVLNLKWPTLSNGEIPAGSGAVGIVLHHGSRRKTVPLLRVVRIPIIGNQYEMTDIGQLDQILDRNIESLIDIHENIGVLAGFGGVRVAPGPPPNPMMPQPPESAGNFYRLLSENYSVQQIDLSRQAIPESIQCLIIPGPKTALSAYDLYQIDQYLMQGRHLAVLLDTFNEVVPDSQQGLQLNRRPPVYIPTETGLGKLLAHYGIRAGQSYVMDENCYVQQMPAQYGGGEQPLYFAPMIQNHRINHRLAVLENIKGFVALNASPLFLDQTVLSENALTAHRLFASSEKSWEMKDRINLNPMFIQPPPADDMRSFDLGYILEGSFPSYFKDKPIPEKPVEDPASPPETDEGSAAADEAPATPAEADKIVTRQPTREKGRPGKILIIASSAMIKDSLIDAEGRSPNDLLMLNLVDFLNDREDTAVLRSKEQRFNPLRELGPGARTSLKFFAIVGLPLLVVLFGLIVLTRRYRRKKHIREMFV